MRLNISLSENQHKSQHFGLTPECETSNMSLLMTNMKAVWSVLLLLAHSTERSLSTTKWRPAIIWFVVVAIGIASKTLLPIRGTMPTSDWTEFRTMKTERITELQAEIRHLVPLKLKFNGYLSCNLFDSYCVNLHDMMSHNCSKVCTVYLVHGFYFNQQWIIYNFYMKNFIITSTRFDSIVWNSGSCQPYAPAGFAHRKKSWYSFLLEAESNPGP